MWVCFPQDIELSTTRFAVFKTTPVLMVTEGPSSTKIHEGTRAAWRCYYDNWNLECTFLKKCGRVWLHSLQESRVGWVRHFRKQGRSGLTWLTRSQHRGGDGRQESVNYRILWNCLSEMLLLSEIIQRHLFVLGVDRVKDWVSEETN